ncbi:MAG: L,D-transpeptidase family protein [Candidatus Saccharimonadales bacterium]
MSSSKLPSNFVDDEDSETQTNDSKSANTEVSENDELPTQPSAKQEEETVEAKASLKIKPTTNVLKKSQKRLIDQQHPLEKIQPDNTVPVSGSMDTMPEPSNSHKNLFHRSIFRLKVISPLTLVIISVVIILFTTFVILFFNSHAVPNSRLGNQYISFWSKQKIQKYVDNQASSYSLQIKNPDQQSRPEIIDISQLDIHILTKETTNDVFSTQFGLLERLQFWKRRSYDYRYTLDKVKIDNFIDAYKTKVNVIGQNATIVIENGEVVIMPEVPQDEISFHDPSGQITNSLKLAVPLTLEQERVITPPAITAAKLQPLKEYIQDVIKTEIILKLNGNNISTTRDQIASWITIDPAVTNNTAVSFDIVKVESFIEGVVSPYIKPPKARVMVATADGGTKELVSGENGVSITDKAGTAKNVINALQNGENSDIEIPVAYSTPTTISAGDYPKWLQVDLTNKRLYAYEHGKLVNQFLISAGAPATPTVVGEFTIKSKPRIQTMRGLNADGTRYVQPNVEWINYFYVDYAIHGNYWRPASVFGNINTSHGCVGLQNADAEWIYNWAPVGTTVITHY